MPSVFYKPTLWLIRAIKLLELTFLRLFFKGRVKQFLTSLLAKGGITINGTNPWDPQIHDDEAYLRIINQGGMGYAMAYIDGLWDVEDFAEFWFRVMRSEFPKLYYNPYNRLLNYLECVHFNLQTPDDSWEVAKGHYNLGNELFEAFLDPSMTYTCGYWRTAANLDDAQFDKMELVAKKLNLTPGMRVLDIGCGWGGLCHHLTKYYGVSVVGVTVSEAGISYAKHRYPDLDIRLCDYRNLLKGKKEWFDRIAAIGCMEHVGPNNYAHFLQVVHSCLKEHGLFVLHTIGMNDPDLPASDPFSQYVFPNGVVPRTTDITKVSDGLFILEDWQNFGYDYYRTLTAWHQNFERNWPSLEATYGKRFYRFWRYYLLGASAYFKSRKLQLWQIVLSKGGVKEGTYYAAR